MVPPQTASDMRRTGAVVGVEGQDSERTWVLNYNIQQARSSSTACHRGWAGSLKYRRVAPFTLQVELSTLQFLPFHEGR
jgi:hypothetical protein